MARLDSLFLSLLKTGSCIRKPWDLSPVFFSLFLKSQCSSPWIYSSFCHPYINPRHSVFHLNVCWILIFLFCLSQSTDSCTLKYSMPLPIHQPCHQRQCRCPTQSQSTPCEYSTITFSLLCNPPTQCGLEHWTCCDYGRESISFEDSRDDATDHSKHICLDTLLTLITANQDKGSEMKLQESQRLQWTLGWFSVCRGGSVLRYCTHLIPNYFWDSLQEDLGYPFVWG